MASAAGACRAGPVRSAATLESRRRPPPRCGTGARQETGQVRAADTARAWWQPSGGCRGRRRGATAVASPRPTGSAGLPSQPSPSPKRAASAAASAWSIGRTVPRFISHSCRGVTTRTSTPWKRLVSAASSANRKRLAQTGHDVEPEPLGWAVAHGGVLPAQVGGADLVDAGVGVDRAQRGLESLDVVLGRLDEEVEIGRRAGQPVQAEGHVTGPRPDAVQLAAGARSRRPRGLLGSPQRALRTSLGPAATGMRTSVPPVASDTIVLAGGPGRPRR